MAFNALFAIFPLLLLAITLLAFVYGSQEAQDKALELVASLAPAVQDIVAENLKSITTFKSITGIVSLIILIWSGKNLFMGLAFALDRALGVPQGRPFFNNVLISLVMLPLVGILLVVATLLPVTITFVVHYGGFRDAQQISQVGGYATSIALVFIVTALLYTYLPNRPMRFRWAVPGALFSAIAWEVAQIGFTLYTTHTNFLHLYGAVSAILALLLWFYLMGVIFLFGAQLCAEWASKEGAVGPGRIVDEDELPEMGRRREVAR